jgi:acylphosphatase
LATLRLRITGKVQGVGYRIWATRTALSLGLRGWVRNRRDGSVEVLATGTPDAVAALVGGLPEGSHRLVRHGGGRRRGQG